MGAATDSRNSVKFRPATIKRQSGQKVSARPTQAKGTTVTTDTEVLELFFEEKKKNKINNNEEFDPGSG